MTQIASSTPTYDANGNVTNDFLNTYSWDSNGRPTTIDGITVTYDALGRMVERKNSGAYTQVLYAPTGAKLAIMSGQILDFGYVPLSGGALAQYVTSGGFYYRHPDWQGSTRLVTQETAPWVYYDGAYSPFGVPYAGSGPGDYSFTGMNQDTAANVYDFPAREYDGTQGRWPSPDPAGMAAVDPTNPQSWNRYAYALNNPLANVDPSGLDACVLLGVNGDAYVINTSESDCDNQGGIYNPGSDAGSPPIVVDSSPDNNLGTDPTYDGSNGADIIFGGPLLPTFSGQGPGCSVSAPAGPSKILTGSVTTSKPTMVLGAYIGAVVANLPGAAAGAIIGNMFGVGGTASNVPSTKSWYGGLTAVFAPLGGGSGVSGSSVNVPSSQNPNSIANGLSYSLTFQPFFMLGSTVVKSPGNKPVVGPSVGNRVPVSFAASYNVCVTHCGC